MRLSPTLSRYIGRQFLIWFAVVSVPGGLGRPSSEADPESVAEAGKVIVWFDPALTVGA